MFVNPPASRPRLALALVGCCAAPLLGGCAPVIGLFGPRPDPSLLPLAVSAEDSGKAEQAEQLFAEITRLCGTDAAGEVPKSCRVDDAAKNEVRTHLAGNPAPRLLDAHAPAESKPLLIKLAVAERVQEGVAAVPTPPASLRDAAAKDPQGMLAARLGEWFYMVAYELDIARAFAEPGDEKRIDGLIQQYQELAEDLPAQPAAFYALQDPPAPTDAASAKSFVNSLNARTNDMLAQEAVQLPAGEEQDWLVTAAAWARTH